MRLLERISTRLLNTPLLITPEYGSVITTVLADRIGVEPMVSSDVVASYRRPNDRDVVDRKNGILTMPIIGGMVHRGDGPEADSGLQSYTALHNKFEAIFADNVTRGILVDGDTGGGEAAGLAELVEWLPKASKQAGKPVWWVSNTNTGSAAYWLASASERIYAAPNSHTGSIGVYVQHTDVSKMLEKRGVVTSFVYAGKHKVDGNPFEALSDEVRASIQTRVDKLYVDFVEAVARNRDLEVEAVRATEARVFGPDEAHSLGLVDGIGGYGDALAAFTEYLNRPFVGYSSHGDHMTKLIYDQEALERARAEGVSQGKQESVTAVAEANAKVTAAADDRKALLAALTDLGKNDPRISTFVEALSDGATVPLAAKFAAKVEAPKAEAPAPVPQSATQKDVDALMSHHSPGVSDEGGNEGPKDPKAARLAEISAGMKVFNKGKGYAVQA